MLARSGPLPTRGDFAYEVKWDEFRAIVSTRDAAGAEPPSWDMTERVTFLSGLPVRAILDGELVALDADGKPDFPMLCEAMLAGPDGDPVDAHRLRRAQHRRPERHRRGRTHGAGRSWSRCV